MLTYRRVIIMSFLLYDVFEGFLSIVLVSEECAESLILHLLPVILTI